jgi:3-hydroxymyristoyl/3-hydroxydecanoyl-(acyl carrier protein) dehydratase
MSVTEPIVTSEQRTALSAEIAFVVPNDLDSFRGHFPSAPVVPGVVQIKWALDFARRVLSVAGEFRGMEALKFQNVMGPGDHVTLTLQWAPDRHKLRFAFQSGVARYSSGRLLLVVP